MRPQSRTRRVAGSPALFARGSDGILNAMRLRAPGGDGGLTEFRNKKTLTQRQQEYCSPNR